MPVRCQLQRSDDNGHVGQLGELSGESKTAAFAATFADAASIRARWPVTSRVGLLRRRVQL